MRSRSTLAQRLEAQHRTGDTDVEGFSLTFHGDDHRTADDLEQVRPEARRFVAQEQGRRHRPVEGRIVVAFPHNGGQGAIARMGQQVCQGDRVTLDAERNVEEGSG